MEDIHCNSNICGTEKEAELEHIEYLITGGADVAKILVMYPRHSKEKIENIVERVAIFCWLNDGN